MSKPVVLDSGPLGRLANPRRGGLEIATWLNGLSDKGRSVFIAEISDYEVRRNLLLDGSELSVERLDALHHWAMYLPLTTAIMRKAAEFWAEVRRQGLPTADRHALDCDVILAAHTAAIGGIVATENVGHLSRFVEARHWREIT